MSTCRPEHDVAIPGKAIPAGARPKAFSICAGEGGLDWSPTGRTMVQKGDIPIIGANLALPMLESAGQMHTQRS
jgi:hypothetical protein